MSRPRDAIRHRHEWLYNRRGQGSPLPWWAADDHEHNHKRGERWRRRTIFKRMRPAAPWLSRVRLKQRSRGPKTMAPGRLPEGSGPVGQYRRPIINPKVVARRLPTAGHPSIEHCACHRTGARWCASILHTILTPYRQKAPNKVSLRGDVALLAVQSAQAERRTQVCRETDGPAQRHAVACDCHIVRNEGGSSGIAKWCSASTGRSGIRANASRCRCAKAIRWRQRSRRRAWPTGVSGTRRRTPTPFAVRQSCDPRPWPRPCLWHWRRESSASRNATDRRTTMRNAQRNSSEVPAIQQ